MGASCEARERFLSAFPEAERPLVEALLLRVFGRVMAGGGGGAEGLLRRLGEAAQEAGPWALGAVALREALEGNPGLLQAGVDWLGCWLAQAQGGEGSPPPRGGVRPTPEQEEALEAFLRGEDMKLLAVAGSGKTTTLRLMAERAKGRRMLYVAFNRSVREEARARFPSNVDVLTLHGLAHRYTVRGDEGYQAKLSRRRGTLPPRDVLEALGLGLEAYPLAYAARGALEAFLLSTAERPGPEHLPPDYEAWRRYNKRLPPPKVLLEMVERLWRRMRNPEDPFPLTFDGFVKVWAEEGGRFPGYEAVLVDEAQDLSPVFSGVLEAKRGEVQRVYVGDPRQQIYAWRGAVNAMAQLEAPEKGLTWSFRFGEALAGGVRALMAYLGHRVPVVGKAPWPTQVAFLPETRPRPYTVLARTNIGVVDSVRALLLPGERVHVVGGVGELTWLLRDAADLRDGLPRPRPHPELLLVDSWGALEELAQELDHPTAKLLVRLGRADDLRALALYLEEVHVDREGEAHVVVSTVHKAKGREWDRVLLWRDFPPVWDEGFRKRAMKGRASGLEEEENILYVALTRAKRVLDLSLFPELAKFFPEGT